MKATTLLFVALATLGVNGNPVLFERQTKEFDSPPYFPAPKGGWAADWSGAYAKAHALVGQMTLAEKVGACISVDEMEVNVCFCRSTSLLLLVRRLRSRVELVEVTDVGLLLGWSMVCFTSPGLLYSNRIDDIV